jgi:hypothetical protein
MSYEHNYNMIQNIARRVGVREWLGARRGRFGFVTPVEKPVMSLAVNAMVEASAECMQFGYVEYGMGA